MKKLTIGMATFDDFEGVYFTTQSLRLNSYARLEEIDLVVIDNNPGSLEGRATRDFCKSAGVRYVEETTWRSTAIRDHIFREAEAPVAMSIDPHVLFFPGAIDRLLDFSEGLKSDDLFHGAMLYDYLDPKGDVVSHMSPLWRDNMYGTWAHTNQEELGDDLFPIEMMGLGCFVCRVEAWKKAGGFHPLFKGFGGEEGYIHHKFKLAGGSTFCIPWLRWIHRFNRPRGIVYPLKIEERICNYLIGWLDLGKDPGEVIDHFKETQPAVLVEELLLPRVLDLLAAYEADPEATLKEWRTEQGEQTLEWNHTQIDLAAPLAIDVKGVQLLIQHLGIKWSTHD